MSASETISKQDNAVVKFAVLAAAVALVGLADAAYLTSKHLSGAQVPCSRILVCGLPGSGIPGVSNILVGKIWITSL